MVLCQEGTVSDQTSNTITAALSFAHVWMPHTGQIQRLMVY
jgi:hypothetical protein